MPKNSQGGKKFKRQKKPTDTRQAKNVRYAEDGEVYAKVLARLGGSRLTVECSDNVKRSAIIPGKMKKRVWMNPGDVLLVSLEATGKNGDCYIECKYKNNEINVLKTQGFIKFEIDEEEDEQGFEFKTDVIDLGQNPDYNLPDSDDENDIKIVPKIKEECQKSDSDSLDIDEI